MKVTVEVPDDYAQRLDSMEADLPQILELGMREWEIPNADEYAGVAEVLETLATLPTCEEILAMRPTAELKDRMAALLAKNRDVGLSPSEDREWRRYEYLEHLVRIAKARAMLKLKSP